MSPVLLIPLIEAERILRGFGYTGVVITSITNDDHNAGSLHHVGKAVDIRTKRLSDRETRILKETLDGKFSQFVVVLENIHLHIEHNPSQIHH